LSLKPRYLRLASFAHKLANNLIRLPVLDDVDEASIGFGPLDDLIGAMIAEQLFTAVLGS